MTFLKRAVIVNISKIMLSKIIAVILDLGSINYKQINLFVVLSKRNFIRKEINITYNATGLC